MSFYVLLSIF